MERLVKQAKLSLEYNDDKSDELIEGDMEYENLDSQKANCSQFVTQHTFSTQTEAYNPDQDEEEVLEIRRTYAHLREELINNNRELSKADSNKLSELIDEANAVFSRVHTTSDASLDSKFMADTADLGVSKVHKLPLFTSDFSLDSYLRIVNQYLSTSSWEDMGKLLSSHWSGVETTDFMLGLMDLEVKKRAVGPAAISIRTGRGEIGPATTPLVVDLNSKSEIPAEELSKETSENVMKVYGVLEGIGSFPFYHFITDPGSFARTVENLFYVSFLVRDNRARVYIPKLAASTNELFIEAIVSDDDSDEQADRNINEFEQLVLGMTTKIWGKTIEKYKIEKSFIDLSQ